MTEASTAFPHPPPCTCTDDATLDDEEEGSLTWQGNLYLPTLSLQGMTLGFFTTFADRQAESEEVIVMDGLEYIDSADEEEEE